MSDYVCPECGMGFPKKVGKVKKKVEGYDDLSRVEKAFLWMVILSGVATTTYTEIHCPECSYVLIGDSE